jgi:hypothetical protein
MSELPDLIQHSVLARIKTATTSAERAKLAEEAFEMVDDDRFPREIPRFMAELPFVGSDNDIQQRIAGAILVAEDPDAQQERSTTAAKDMVEVGSVKVWNIWVAPSNLDEGSGAYLLIDCTVGSAQDHRIINSGAWQICARLARAYADDKLPLWGAFAAVGGTGRKGNPVLTFVGEDQF